VVRVPGIGESFADPKTTGKPYATYVSSEPPEAPSFAERLRLLRARLGLSQEQLARRLSVSFATVNRWEAGRSRPSARAAAAIAELEASASRGQRPAQGQEPAEGRTVRLPIAQSSFVGRERELAELSGLLTRSRLISLIGPGGAGKTRLAVEAVRRLAGSAGSGAAASGAAGDVVFVPLERAVQPPRSAASRLAARLGVRDRRDVPQQEAMLAALKERPGLLLLLDGAEHHREELAGLVGELLAAAPGLRIVVTSRVILGVPGEVCWAVPPLDCPPVAAAAPEVASSDAVRLFIARATERLPGFSAADVPPHAVGELCRRLGGLPLAIELIAGWVGTLSVREIVQQRVALLEYDPPGAQGSRKLADVLRASYDLLEPGQQQTLRLLSVFAAPFSLTDAQAVIGVDEPAAAAALRGLVDASWLAVIRGVEQNRFSMVEIIRAFAAARLRDAGETAQTRGRHARYFAGLAAHAASSFGGPDVRSATARLEAGVDDLRTTLEWAAETGEIDFGLEVSASLTRWWLSSGRLSIGRAWLTRFLALAEANRGGGEPTVAGSERIGRAMCWAATLASENGDYAEGVRLARQAMRIFEPLDPGEDLAFAATALGSAQRYLGDRAGARRSFQTALDLRTAVGDRAKLVMATNNLALIEIDDGNFGRARELLEQNLIIKRQLGEPRSIAIGLVNLADVLVRDGRWQPAHTSLAEAAELAVGLPQIMGLILCSQGNLEATQRNWKQAAGLYADAVAAAGIGGHTHDVIEAMIGLGRACHELGQADEATRHLRTAEAMAHEIANPQLLAQATAALAETAADPLPGNLTARQAEVLRLLADGLSNKEIAARLYLSPGTVERHLATIYRKLGLGGRVEAARYAVEHGLAQNPNREML